MSDITITHEEIEAWMRDIQLFTAELSHPLAWAEPVLPIDIGSRSKICERLLKLSSLLNTMGGGLGPIRISSPCVPNAELIPILKQEYILEIFSGIIDEIQREKASRTQDGWDPWKRDFLNGLKIPLEFKKLLGTRNHDQ